MSADLSFGMWLKRRRRGLGMTQIELGRQIGYAGETIRKVEADEVRPSRQLTEALAVALEIAPQHRAHPALGQMLPHRSFQSFRQHALAMRHQYVGGRTTAHGRPSLPNAARSSLSPYWSALFT